MKKRNIPPNLFREFSLFHWKNFDSRLVQQVRTELIQHIQSFDGKPFIGIEKDTPTFHIASEILKNLDIRNEIILINKPFEKVNQNFSGYTILTNPPYGQRVGDLKSQEQLFLNFHKFLDRQGPFRQVGVLHPSLEKFSFFKGRIKKAVELFNGPIPTKFYILNG